ncbi:UDP-N-acetylmuramoyl-tripeptide--D-alanyl-D-alanine ligase [Cohnella luojiensis]|uniref:UDP-N-acetylmuramoyl-tripeptide--D-alanyl-D-alanine ligase n=1 Tax=Cohnella luojiensis TaxID=652876 RepID=A0A4Y8LP20_9BACL|nr:UDP-N-acetylmuramoyl-tripeptide--D-alanyl-D-alanine ligase [Cohnella luojiensis]TFE22755.1 UDP-N-acetylmuramoyl-tripeptide--D-alanyl-D-alanine ligase [Cohnella luojiensis]
MIRRTLQQISVMGLTSIPTNDQKKIKIDGVSIDTRTLCKGNLYIPIVGDRFNGHDFVALAIEKGAAAVLWNRDEPNPPLGKIPVLMVKDTLLSLQSLAREYRSQLQATVIGITGSNGKTSTKDMLADCLAMQFKTQKTFGNLNNHLGVPLTLLSLEEDTEMAVVEMGMSGLGEIELLSRMAQPDIAVITNIGEAHLGDLGSTRNIIQAKLEILSGLKDNGTLIYNGDHVLLAGAVQSLKDDHAKINFGWEPMNDYHPISAEMDRNGSTFSIAQYPSLAFTVPLAGKHQILNALAVVAASVAAGMSRNAIRNGLANARITNMRNEIIEGDRFILINDTYKSNPSSAVAALDTLSLWPVDNQKIAVLGDMQDLGEQAVSMHHHVGSSIDGEKLDYLFTFGPLSLHTADSARRLMSPERVFNYEDKPNMIAHIQSVLKTDAVVLVKGSRAMKLEEVVSSLIEGHAQLAID